MKKRASKKAIRHPTRKVLSKPTHPLTPISITNKERALLKYLHQNYNKIFNLRNYHRITNIPRSTIYDWLYKLENYGLVKTDLANHKITEKGMILLQSQENRGVGASRRECRKINKLSTHYNKFKLPIKNRDRFLIPRIRELNPENIRENKLHNLHQIIVYFNDATVVINPKQMIINLYDVISDDVDESDFKNLSRAIEYAKKFMRIGMITEGMMVEEGHWARIESLLSDFLFKIDERYYLDLGDGKKFWIDHSYKREDETNDKIVRERVDRFLTEVANNDVSLLDINKITKALGFISKIESSRLLNEIDLRKKQYEKLEKIDKNYHPSYFG